MLLPDDENNIGIANDDTHKKYTDAYINILNTYDKKIDESIIEKKRLKYDCFNAIRFIMYFLTIFFAITVIASFVLFGIMAIYKYQSVSVVVGAVTALISSFVTMITSIFKIPEIITKDLFNKEEDRLMNEVIRDIQKYEIDAVRLEKIKSENIARLSTLDEGRKNEDGNHMESSPKEPNVHPDNLEDTDITNIS